MLPLLLLAACRPETPPPLNVVIVVVDGIRVDDGFTEATSELSGQPGVDTLPSLWRELAPQGTLLTDVRNLGATITAPAHATLVTGARTPLANLANDFGPGVYRPRLPTLFEEAARQSDSAGMILANQSLVEPCTHSMASGYGPELAARWSFVPAEPGSVQPAQHDEPVFAQLSRELTANRPQVTLVNLKAVDRVGHYGAGPEAYLGAIREVDEPLVALWYQLQTDPHYAGNTVLLITSDHGRHRGGEGEYWRNHGDSSAGDREIPALLLGQGIPAGEVIDTPVTLSDLAPTLAALAGWEMPWAEGLPVEGLATGGRQGVARIAAQGEWVVEQRWSSDPEHRSAIWLGDQQLSSESAFAAEDPQLVVSGTQAWTCWRELTLDLNDMPWVPRCAELRDGQLSEVFDGPEVRVGPFWSPQLQVLEGDLWLTYSWNPEDIGTLGAAGDVAVRQALWDGSDWEVGQPAGEVRYPTHAQASRSVQVFAGNPDGNEARDNRRLYAQTASWGDQGFEVGVAEPIDADGARPLTGLWRVEQPVLRAQGAQVQVLAVGMGEEGLQILRVDSADGGASWGQAERLSDSAGLQAHLDPIWADDTPSWIDSTQVCTPERCWDHGQARVRDWAWTGSAWLLVAETAPSVWEIVVVERS